MAEFTNSVYQTHRGVNGSVEFHGIKGKFLYYFAGAIIGSFLIFILLYVTGISPFMAALIAVLLGMVSIGYIMRISKQYGVHGMAKKTAQVRSAKLYQIKSRKVFLRLKENV